MPYFASGQINYVAVQRYALNFVKTYLKYKIIFNRAVHTYRIIKVLE